jgi:hypothetical protein
MEDNTPQTKQQEDRTVQDAMRKVLALRKLAKGVNMRTTHSQTAVLKTLSPAVLARVAVILAEMEEAVQ